jgi:hypothetical protein
MAHIVWRHWLCETHVKASTHAYYFPWQNQPDQGLLKTPSSTVSMKETEEIETDLPGHIKLGRAGLRLEDSLPRRRQAVR